MAIETPRLERAAEIRKAVTSKYREVAQSPAGHFAYPVGPEGALKLGYDSSWIELVPQAVVDRFVSVGNPFSIHTPKLGDRILDAGCGCGFDTFIAASMAGSGTAVGVDITAEMLDIARSASATFRNGNIEFVEGSIEQLPFDDGRFDLIISNGVLNLVPLRKLISKGHLRKSHESSEPTVLL